METLLRARLTTLSRTAYAALVLFLTLLFTPDLRAATGENAMVISPDPRATQVALDVLKKGGNAVDAAVAAQWMLNVVEPQSSGIGGGGSLLFYDVGTRRILFFDGSVKAPAEAFPKMFLGKDQRPLPYSPDRNTGGFPVGVPGLLKLMEEVHAKYGTHKFPMEKLIEPAVGLAEKGMEVSPALARAIREDAARLALTDPQKEVFFDQGMPFQKGRTLTQPELARALRLIQSKGAKVFYEGSIGDAIERAVHKNPFREGLLSYRDLRVYSIAVREPVHSNYQGYELFSAGPPAEGGVMLIRALNLLSIFNVQALGAGPELYHLLGEVQKTAFSSHAGVADPDLFDVPVQELLSEAWARKKAKNIQLDKVLKSGASSVPVPERGKKRTGTSVMIVDPHGSVVILTATLGDTFGSTLRVPGYGFFLNDLLTGFAADPFSSGGPQSAAVISGEQRPVGPEAPVFLFKEGQPFALLSAYGAEDPAAVLLNMIVRKTDLKASCRETVEAPRLLVRGRTLYMEPGLYAQDTARLKLELMGHDIEKEDGLGTGQMVCFEDSSGRIDGETDPRGTEDVAGY